MPEPSFAQRFALEMKTLRATFDEIETGVEPDDPRFDGSGKQRRVCRFCDEPWGGHDEGCPDA